MSSALANPPRSRSGWILRGAGMVVTVAMVWVLATAIPHPEPELLGLQLTRVASGLTQPVAAAAQPGTERIFVVERFGTVRVFDRWVLDEEPAIDLTDKVAHGSWEQGALGLALHPEYARNGRVFVSYTEIGSEDQLVVEYRTLEPGGARFDPTSEVEVLRIPQTSWVHQGGTIAFGPDGYLWVGLGDGGPRNQADGTQVQDPEGHGQNPHTLPGSLVRIDVDGGDPYAIPPDNPFTDGVDGAPEVWAYGLRNPWSFTFDNGRLIVADVGHVSYEEVDVVALDGGAGANFGWSVWEGPECFEDRPCASVEAVVPFLAVSHPELCAIIGGPVYRGSAIPEVTGQYFFADLCTGSLRSVTIPVSGEASPTMWLGPSETMQVTAMFADADGEIHLLTLEGDLYRVDPIR